MRGANSSKFVVITEFVKIRLNQLLSIVPDGDQLLARDCLQIIELFGWFTNDYLRSEVLDDDGPLHVHWDSLVLKLHREDKVRISNSTQEDVRLTCGSGASRCRGVRNTKILKYEGS